MTPKQLGHRAAAQGHPREAPVSGDLDAWLAGFDAAEVHRKNGLDPSGHSPALPHLCRRATRANPAVCDCCENCQVVCWLENLPERAMGSAAFASVKSLLRKFLP